MQRPEQLRLDIEKCRVTLKTELLKLATIQIRLAGVEKQMQDLIVIDVFRAEKTHAQMLANELSVIRKVAKLVSDLKVVYETMILRTESIEDYSKLLSAINPAVTGLKGIQKDLVNVMPVARKTFARMFDMFSDTLVTLDLPNELNPIEAADGALDILEEASTLVEEEIKRKFPTLPELRAEGRVAVQT